MIPLILMPGTWSLCMERSATDFVFIILAFGLMRFSIFVISGEVLTGRGSSDSSLVNDLESNLFLGFEAV